MSSTTPTTVSIGRTGAEDKAYCTVRDTVRAQPIIRRLASQHLLD